MKLDFHEFHVFKIYVRESVLDKMIYLTQLSFTRRRLNLHLNCFDESDSLMLQGKLFQRVAGAVVTKLNYFSCS